MLYLPMPPLSSWTFTAIDTGATSSSLSTETTGTVGCSETTLGTFRFFFSFLICSFFSFTLPLFFTTTMKAFTTYISHVLLLLRLHSLITGYDLISFTSQIYFHFISFHFISFHFISFHFISFHFISFHFISFHFISFHFISFHFISFHLLTCF